MEHKEREKKSNPAALLPILIFLLLYLGLGYIFEYRLKIEMGFYSIPIVVVFMVALLVACLQNRALSFDDKLAVMARGVGDKNIMTMILIFLVAGVFVGVTGRDSAEAVAYFLLSVTPIENEKKASDESTFYHMKGVYAIIGFLVVNVFLGLLGSFWFRVQARRSEIGLRVAMGSSKRKVRRMIVSETLLLLSMACVIGTAVCLNLSKTDLVEAIGIPIANRAAWGIGAEQDAINFAATSVFLAIVSVFAVWYPARQASEVPPADVLREE